MKDQGIAKGLFQIKGNLRTITTNYNLGFGYGPEKNNTIENIIRTTGKRI